MIDTTEYKGDIAGFPREVVERMLECQVEQGNKRDVTVFEMCASTGLVMGGFNYSMTKERYNFWCRVIASKDFDHFFARYPKSQIASSETQTTASEKTFDELLDEVAREYGFRDYKHFGISGMKAITYNELWRKAKMRYTENVSRRMLSANTEKP